MNKNIKVLEIDIYHGICLEVLVCELFGENLLIEASWNRKTGEYTNIEAWQSCSFNKFEISTIKGDNDYSPCGTFVKVVIGKLSDDDYRALKSTYKGKNQ